MRSVRLAPLLLVIPLKAQLSGTIHVPSTYSSVAAAISALNAQGISGAVTVNIAAGHTETVAAGGYSLTATGNATAGICFRKTGNGANPLLVAYAGNRTPGSSMQDGLLRLIGCDHVTIDGLDLYDPNVANPATMEFGIGLFKASATDGCHHIIVRNCNITLSRVNNAQGSAPAADGSRGIDMVNALPGSHNAPLSITAISGAHSYNSFHGNTISNCNTGISLWGYAGSPPYLFCDRDNTIGGPGQGEGNTILNFGGGGSSSGACGVRASGQYNLMVLNNYIDNNNGGGVNHTATLRGVHLTSAPGANVSVAGNTLSIHSGGTGSLRSVIENAAGAGSSGNMVRIQNNLIRDCTNENATTGNYYGIWNSASSSSLEISNNVFDGNSSGASGGSTYLIYNSGAVADIIDLHGNTLQFFYNGMIPYSGSLYGVYNSAAAPTASVEISLNVIGSISHQNATGTGGLYLLYNTSTCTAFSATGNLWRDVVLNHSGPEYFIHNASVTSALLTVATNSMINYERMAPVGNLYGYYGNAGAPSACVMTFSANVFSGITAAVAGTGSFYGFYCSEGSAAPFPLKIITGNTVSTVSMNTSGGVAGFYVADAGDGGSGGGSVVSGNLVRDLISADDVYGLYLAPAGSPSYQAKVSGNTVKNLATSGVTSTVCGAWLGISNAGAVFSGNRISGISANGTGGTAHGIFTSASGPVTLHNNIVGHVQSPNSSGSNRCNGICVSAAAVVQAHHNTVFLSNTGNCGSNALYAFTGATVSLMNNILVNLSSATGTAIASAYRRSGSSLAGYVPSSGNNLFYSGAPGANHVIFHNGSAYATLAGFQALVAPRDSASITQLPFFSGTVPASPQYLHIDATNSSSIESGASFFTGVTTDYDGDPRHGANGYTGNGTAPDIGADEYDQNAQPCQSAVAGSIFPPSQTVCAAECALLSVSGHTGSGYQFQWLVASSPGGPYSVTSSGSGFQAREHQTGPLSAGAYYFVLSATCSAGSSTAVSPEGAVVVQPVPVVTVTALPTVACKGQPVVFTAAGNQGAGYFWSGPGGFSSALQSPTLVVPGAGAGGIYSCRATANGCSSAPATVSIAVGDVTAAIAASDHTICQGSAATLALVSSAASHTWSTGSGSGSIAVSPTLSTVYTVVVTGTNGCVTSRSLALHVVQPTIAPLGNVSCTSPAVATIGVNTFTPSVISWFSSPASTVAIGAGPVFTVNSSSTATYYAEALFALSKSLTTVLNGTTGVQGLMFDVKPFNNIRITGIDLHITSSTQQTLEAWYRPGTFLAASTSSAGWMPAGSVAVSGNGPGILTQLPLTLDIPVAAGQTCAIYVCSTSGTITCSPGGTLSAWSANGDLLLSSGHAGSYFNATVPAVGLNGALHYTKAGCISPRIPVTLTVTSLPQLTLTAIPSTVCPGRSATLTAAGATAYSWSPGGSGALVVVSPTAATVYSVAGWHVPPCQSASTVAVALHSVAPVVAAASQTAVCPSSAVTFTAGGALSYTWSTGAVGSPVTFSPALNSVYTVTGSAPNGCLASASVAVITMSVPVIKIVASSSAVCPGETVMLSATGASSYTWMPGHSAGSSCSFTPVTTSAYNVIGTSVNGCSNVAFAVITVEPCAGLAANKGPGDIVVFPVPATAELTVLLPGETARVSLLDIAGKEIRRWRTSEHELKADLSGCPPGVYILEAAFPSGAFVYRKISVRH